MVNCGPVIEADLRLEAGQISDDEELEGREPLYEAPGPDVRKVRKRSYGLPVITPQDRIELPYVVGMDSLIEIDQPGDLWSCNPEGAHCEFTIKLSPRRFFRGLDEYEHYKFVHATTTIYFIDTPRRYPLMATLHYSHQRGVDADTSDNIMERANLRTREFSSVKYSHELLWRPRLTRYVDRDGPHNSYTGRMVSTNGWKTHTFGAIRCMVFIPNIGHFSDRIFPRIGIKHLAIIDCTAKQDSA